MPKVPRSDVVRADPTLIAASAYHAAGWVGLLELPAGEKFGPSIEGRTGRTGQDMPLADVLANIRKGKTNLALRLPRGVIAIDPDGYGDKCGDKTLAEVEAKLGKLPPTWSSTARGADSNSRHYFYRVPVDSVLHGEIKPDVDILQWFHRYSLVWPSTNAMADGAQVRWYLPSGVDSGEVIPRIDQLAVLSPAWLKYLTNPNPTVVGGTVSDQAAAIWLNERDDEQEVPDTGRVRDALDRALDHISHGESMSRQYELIQLVGEGHLGAVAALREFEQEFIATMTGKGRSTRVAQAEWDRGLGSPVYAAQSKSVAEVPGEPDPLFEQQVLHEVRRIRVREEAQRRMVAASAKPIPDVKSLSDLLSEPDEEELFRVDRVWPVEGHVLLSAQYKAGKTTMRNNLIQALVDDVPFLGSFKTALGDQGRIGVLDFEMGSKKNRQWLRDMGIVDSARVDFLDMRGASSSLNLLDVDTRKKWAALIRERGWTIPILDPISPALVALGLDENSNKDVRTFLNAWEEMLADAGVYESLVLHHSGHSGDRSRGAAAFRDWPSAYWDLNRERDKNGDTDDTAPSYFKAKGRDVDYPESALEYEHAHRQLVIKEEGASRKTKRSAETREARTERVGVLYEQCKQWLESNPEAISARAWRRAGTGSNAELDEVYRMAQSQGLVARHISKTPHRRSEGV